MISFLIALVVLIVGYLTYGLLMEKVFGVDVEKKTPAYELQDGVDYIPMPWWRLFLIQLLNIAGMGPIFGAIMGVVYGPAAFLWITFGTIFGGAVHDYFSGMMSIRSNGASLPDLIGQHLGKTVKWIMLIFMFCLLVQVGAVFVKGPAELLVSITPDYLDLKFFIIVIFSYYMLATLLPIDKIIGKLYPYFAVALMFMVIGVLVALIWHWPAINEVFDGLGNMHPQKEKMPIFPMMFISIACGAVSGFHATQSPLVARCMKNERYGRRIFYGAMVLEGVIALVWAAAAIGFFQSVEGLQSYLGAHGNNAAIVVNTITHTWLGKFGAVLAMLGVIVAPITSGDTALRSCRLMVADMFKWDQKPIWARLAISIPIFFIVIVLLNVDFKILWRYFAWSNQTLSVFTFWTITIYLWKKNKVYWIALIPALFMTMVCSSYILMAPEGFALSQSTALIAAGMFTFSLLCFFFVHLSRSKNSSTLIPEK